jgi:hypothetical protein
MRLVRFLAMLVGFMGMAMVDAGEQWPLQPIIRPADIPGEKQCLPFFVATTHVTERIIFWYKASDGSLKREMISKTSVAVRVLEDNQKPTYEKASADGYQDGATFRLNRADYEKARACLPEPTKTQ